MGSTVAGRVLGDGGQGLAQQQHRRRLVAHVAVVAHGDALRASAKASIGPSARSAAAKAGATASAISRWRSIAAGEPTPSQKASPGPSFIGL